MTRADAIAATEAAIRGMGKNEVMGVLKLNGHMPPTRRTRRSTNKASVLHFGGGRKHAVEAVTLMRKNKILCLYNEYAPDEATILMEDLEKADMLLSGAYIPFSEI